MMAFDCGTFSNFCAACTIYRLDPGFPPASSRSASRTGLGHSNKVKAFSSDPPSSLLPFFLLFFLPSLLPFILSSFFPSHKSYLDVLARDSRRLEFLSTRVDQSQTTRALNPLLFESGNQKRNKPMVLCPQVVLVHHQGSDVLWHENDRNTAKMEQERGWEVAHKPASFSSQHTLAMALPLKALGSDWTFIK